MTTVRNLTTEQSTGSQKFKLGPGLLITAAFIGPGTVVTASRAGAEHGLHLLWTILLSTLGAIILQSLAAYVGIAAGSGLGEVLRKWLKGSPWFGIAASLVVCALGIGNSAYQTGNITGAAAALQTLLGGETRWWCGLIAAVAILVVSLPKYKWLQGVFVALVAVLSLSFLATALLCLPDAQGETVAAEGHSISSESLTLVLALIGTTIVPYNLFLHSSGAAENWQGWEPSVAFRQALKDTFFSISLGGLVTAAILVTANSAFYIPQEKLDSIGGIARQLEPSLGKSSSLLFSFGLLAAGVTSAITAPLATAYAICGILGWKSTFGSAQFRIVAYIVIVVGALLATVFGAAPAQTIVFAQLTNALLLPLVAVFLIWATSRFQHIYRLSAWLRLLGVLVVLLVSTLAMWKLVQIFI